MNFKEIQDLIKLIVKTELSEFKMKDGDFEVAIRTKNFSKSSSAAINTQQIQPMVAAAAPAPVVVNQALAPAPPNVAAASSPDAGAEAEDTSKYLEVRSPIVGTFYRSAGPDKDPFIKVGDNLNVGDVVCIVEAMKLFNEIESEISGKVVKVICEDASPVEYDQLLFLVDPKG